MSADARHSTELVDRAKALRADGLTYQAVADRLAADFPVEAGGISRDAVAAVLRGQTLRRPERRHRRG